MYEFIVFEQFGKAWLRGMKSGLFERA